MTTPILIPARNEANSLSRTLDTLAAQIADVEPIVIANGCVDNTAELARDSGAVVLESVEGKAAALQEAFRYLGSRALMPLIILDADSVPISTRWSIRMTEAVQATPETQPVIGWGPIKFKDGPDAISDILRTFRSTQILMADRKKPRPRTLHGANMALRIATEKALTAILELPNYWPGVDVAIHDTVIAAGGIRKHILHPQAFVEVDGARFPSLRYRLRYGHKATSLQVNRHYLSEAAPNTLAYKP